MLSSVRTVEIRRWVSEVRPEIETETEAYADVIAWGDAHPRAWNVILGTRSHAYGRNSNHYIGYHRGPSANAALARLSDFKERIENPSDDLFSWSARFTLEHHGRRGFTSGFFREHCVHTDGREYPRHCATLDYTPETIEQVIDRFLAWCDGAGCRYEGRTRVTVDGRDVRTMP